ncbi:MAG: NHL repeat-containing protein [Cyclobacteriaceae bacterium]|nr:NHL repeat-containing protein [Cyclobacteriaceae bacterium]
MKQKLIIGLSLLLLLVVVFLMWKDFFNDKKSEKNVYEYELDQFKNIDTNLVCYSEINQFKPDIDKIKGIAVDNKDRIYVSGSDKVLIFDKTGELVQDFSIGKESNCIAINENGNIYLGVSDHIEIYDFSGNLIKSWESPNQKTLITSIAIGESSIFVADAGNRYVHHYNTEGEYQNHIGRKNKEKGIKGFFIPSPYFDVLIGRDDELWVVDPGRHKFMNFSADGEIISSWSKTSMQLEGFSGCCNPSHIAMLANGSFVTSEKGIERVKIHKPSGEFDCVVAGPELFEKETRGLDLAVDSEDRIIVLDPKKKLVRIFALINENK